MKRSSEMKAETLSIMPEMPGFSICNDGKVPVFLMTLTGYSDLWMYLCSNGGLTAGRGDSDNALFPYYTEDKLATSVSDTGPVTMIRLSAPHGKNILWEPFSEFADVSNVSRSIFKSVAGDAVVFSETRTDFGLVFRYAWRSSAKYGFIRTAWLENKSSKEVSVEILDGLRNIMPWGVPSYMQESKSCLCDAYKRSETRSSRLAVYALSSIIVDRAEPAEALRANVVWSDGLSGAKLTLTGDAVRCFRHGDSIPEVKDCRGERGAYLLRANLKISAGKDISWNIIADVAKNHAGIDNLLQNLSKKKSAINDVRLDISECHERLIRLVSCADGIQDTGNSVADAHHFSNTLFNIMRGGTFQNNGMLETSDFLKWLRMMSPSAFARCRRAIEKLPKLVSPSSIRNILSKDPEASWLSGLYLPLCFGRRHGDPSRPWNKFLIAAPNAEGIHPVHYEGNWRDVFQNWEALSFSYPDYVISFVRLFLSSTTADGYNPYKLTERGFDWEIPNPADAWSHIGYWSDHQIIYLQKLIEGALKFGAVSSAKDFATITCACADVPYRIRNYSDILKNSSDTVDYDEAHAEEVRLRTEEYGQSGKYVHNAAGHTVLMNGIEKMFILLLAKIANFVPDGGIWMNTQRPEWNDANNALAGKGLSMVTVCYLRRFSSTLHEILQSLSSGYELQFTSDVAEWVNETSSILRRNRAYIKKGFDPISRRKFLDAVGSAASTYRTKLYKSGISSKNVLLSAKSLTEFIGIIVSYLDATIVSSRRVDGLYHSYNTVSFGRKTLEITYLQEMLEGQVAVLSSGLLRPDAALDLLHALRRSAIYCPERRSYMLYPEKLPLSFFEKNQIPSLSVMAIPLLLKMAATGDTRIVEEGAYGMFHFNANFRKAEDLAIELEQVAPEYESADAVMRDCKATLALYEKVFHHAGFTGRSGSFFAYEGVGSIYWHMVAKLLLATGENIDSAEQNGAPASVKKGLRIAYSEIRSGLGASKTPEGYGAFPTDPYSHTPKNGGARQPGMTGQVKEELIARIRELGILLDKGRLTFGAGIYSVSTQNARARKVAIPLFDTGYNVLELKDGEIVFTFCGTPVIMSYGAKSSITVIRFDGSSSEFDGLSLDCETSAEILSRGGKIKFIRIESPLNAK